MKLSLKLNLLQSANNWMVALDYFEKDKIAKWLHPHRRRYFACLQKPAGTENPLIRTADKLKPKQSQSGVYLFCFHSFAPPAKFEHNNFQYYLCARLWVCLIFPWKRSHIIEKKTYSLCLLLWSTDWQIDNMRGANLTVKKKPQNADR